MIRATFEVESSADFLNLLQSAKGIQRCTLKDIVTTFRVMNAKQCVTMTCIGVLSPPIVYQPPTENVPYYIQIMQCQPSDGSAVVLIPYVNLNPSQNLIQQALAPLPNSPRTEVQFQTVGVNPQDPSPNLLYYQTMTITQGSAGFTIFRHRLRNAGPGPYPQTNVLAIGQESLTSDLDVTVYQPTPPTTPPSDITFPVQYVHRTINDGSDPGNPTELYLQQPF